MSPETEAGKMPVRIQRKRTKGWRMPPNTVYVGRPTKWGNPYVLDDSSRESRMVAVKEYQAHWWRDYGRHLWRFDGNSLSIIDVRELRGKNLACWCPLDQPCHADVLLEIANAQK